MSVIGPLDRDDFLRRGVKRELSKWLVLDAKRHPPRVMCRCLGWNAPKNAALIVAALEAHNSELYAKLALGYPGRLNEPPAVKPLRPSGDSLVSSSSCPCSGTPLGTCTARWWSRALRNQCSPVSLIELDCGWKTTVRGR